MAGHRVQARDVKLVLYMPDKVFKTLHADPDFTTFAAARDPPQIRDRFMRGAKKAG